VAAPSTYRPDIDGIRAIAVMAVVIFHAFPNLLTGGFVGVDVFFVISGFLITQIVRRQIAEGQFSFAVFYEHRIRRLLPALILVIAVTAVVALFVLPPGDLKSFGRSIGPSIFFTANWHFSHHVGYFAPPDDVRPLLHLWSLGVEEQFYIFWPITLWLLTKRGPITVRIVTLFLIAVSLFADEYLAHRNTMAAFFSTPLRAWEPLIGAALGLNWLPPIRRVVSRELAAAIGLLLILGSVLTLRSTSPFPGLAATPACLGAACLLHVGREGPPTWASRALTLSPVVFLGAMSYSLYLWHWPILTFLRLGSPQEPPAVLMFGGLLLSIGLAAVSLISVERRFRRRPAGGLTLPKLYLATFLALAITAGCGEALSADEGLRFRARGFVAQADAAEHDFPSTTRCNEDFPGPRPQCDFGAARVGPPNLLLWGDSEAEALEPAVALWATANGLKGRLISDPACPPTIGVDVHDEYGKRTGCREHNDLVVKTINASPDLTYVVIAARWAMYDKGPDADHPNPYLTASDGVRDTAKFHGLLDGGLRRGVSAIDGAARPNLRIIILGPTPEFRVNAPRCAERAVLVGRNPEACYRTPEADIQSRQAASQQMLGALQKADPKVRVLQAGSALCDGQYCSAKMRGQIIYRDSTHLTAKGAAMIAPAIFGEIGRVQ
jgi:peptidoglycan/LPS O-acetylase OafA/YrhL